MPDKEVILGSLQKVERRIRANRFFAELSRGFALFLVFLVVFKLCDLYSPMTARTVVLAVGLGLLLLTTYSIWLLRQKGTLAQAAASVDDRLTLHDEIKSAYWFITNPLASPWVESQIERAARRARSIDVKRLYPRMLPRTSYLAAGMFLLVVGLNFSSLSLNHNWFALEAAPAYALTDREQQLLERASELLLKLNDPGSADKLRQVLEKLQTGQMDSLEALRALEEMRNILEEGKLDLESINAGLEEIARDLSQSRQLKPAADLIFGQKLDESGQAVRTVAGKIESVSAPDLAEMGQSLDRASGHSRPGLDALSIDLKKAALGVEQSNRQDARDGLVHAAQDLEQLALQIEIQQLKDDASNALADLEDEIRRQTEQNSGQQDAEQAAGWDSPLPEDKAGFDGAPAGNEAHGLDPSGEAVANPLRAGRPTSLKVQLQKERLAGQHGEGVPEGPKEATQQEHSGIDHTSVTPNPNNERKDVLKQDSIPWDYRPLIRNYFESIHD